jgi:hypothetical protein
MAVYTRPLWQYYQHELHIYTKPIYLMVKTMFQMLIMVIAKTVQDPPENVVIYFTVFSLYAALNFKIGSFNYPVL